MSASWNSCIGGCSSEKQFPLLSSLQRAPTSPSEHASASLVVSKVKQFDIRRVTSWLNQWQNAGKCQNLLLLQKQTKDACFRLSIISSFLNVFCSTLPFIQQAAKWGRDCWENGSWFCISSLSSKTKITESLLNCRLLSLLFLKKVR